MNLQTFNDSDCDAIKSTTLLSEMDWSKSIKWHEVENIIKWYKYVKLSV